MYVCECMYLKLELNCNQYVCTGKIIRMVRLDHALCCRKGGLIIQGHNEICDAIGDLAALVWSQVPSEPVVKDASEDSDALIADLGVRGVWQSQVMALFDIRVVETDALSSSAEAEKKQKYCSASSDHRATFTPLRFSVDGLVGDEVSNFCNVWHILYLLSGIIVLVRSLAGCMFI